MGKIARASVNKIRLTPKQQIIFNEVRLSNFLKNNFYFTGGTALSSVYLNHRISDDLDFFSQERFDIQPVVNSINEWGEKHNFKTTIEDKEVVKIFNLQFSDGEKLKVDFGYYPYKRLKKGESIDYLEVDSLLDIAVNKLQTIRQRSEVKDFVDLYFLLQTFTLWDLMEGTRIKFRMEIDPYLVAIDCLKVERFENLPVMLKPLSLDQIKKFYKDLAKKISKKAVED